MRHRFHALCPYFAMFPEIFVQKHLVWCRPGELVFDPFSGRGTTVFESLLNGRRAAGCDTNPVAVCVSRAKSTPPSMMAALNRVSDLEALPINEDLEAEVDTEFFRLCFHPTTLLEVLHLRRHLAWRTDEVDCFVAAVALGCLHGESHRSERYFSNRMPRTISTKPDYSVRWWKDHGYLPPQRDVFEILKTEIEYRFVTPPAAGRGVVLQGDVRTASQMFPEHAGDVSLVVTSPPYLDTTNFAEDQWLRIWFLGGASRPASRVGGDDRHTSVTEYWKFLREAWFGLAALLKPNARLIIRMGGSKLSFDETTAGLYQTLEAGLNRSLTLVERRISAIADGQLRSFRPHAEGTKVEFDFHFAVDY